MKDSDKTFIRVTWSRPSNDGGAKIDHYNIEKKDPKTERWQKINRTPVTVIRGSCVARIVVIGLL